VDAPLMHPALVNPFMFSDGVLRGSLPSGESEPSVTLACTPSEPADAQNWLLAGGASAGSNFILDVEAFMAEVEEVPLFLQRVRS
jgi:hypothetical protein